MLGTWVALNKLAFLIIFLCSNLTLPRQEIWTHPREYKDPVHFGIITHFMNEEFEALRRLHDLAMFIRPLDDEAWDHVSFSRNLKVCRNDYAKGIGGMNRNPHLYPLVQFLITCARQVQTQRLSWNSARTWFRFFSLFILLFKREKAIQVRDRDRCEKYEQSLWLRWDVRKKVVWSEEAESARLLGKGTGIEGHKTLL